MSATAIWLRLIYLFGIFVGKTKVDQEKDADAEGEHPGDVRLVAQAKTSQDDKEDTSDEVDEELHVGNTAANDEVDEAAGHDDGIADKEPL